jgi:predicted nicotinamide N-methyase
VVDRPVPADAALADFIRRTTRLRRPVLVPEIVLRLADEVTPLWHLTEAELVAEGLPPPYWAFAWAGGQALARFLLDHPAEVAGRRILDFGSGSGLVAIAAQKAGAAGVLAADADPFARAAIGLNAAANGAAPLIVGDPTGAVPDVDLILCGDVFYERSLAALVLPWLSRCRAAGIDVLVGDPSRSHLPLARLQPVASYLVPDVGAVEEETEKRAGVWRLSAD